ncbi:MAG: mechanosensitive ion channel family protein [Treponema sp.]|jgi:MscS family membrane protein|nr:mechanosensitive ion channel family protein [Treponema sp.]
MEKILAYSFLNNTVKQWLFVAGYIAGGFLVGILCVLILSLIAKYVTQKTKNSLDNEMVKGLKTPFIFLCCIGGISMGIQILNIEESIHTIINRVVTSVVILVLALGINRIVDIIIRHSVPAKANTFLSKHETDLQPILRRICRIVLWTVAITFFLRNIGYDVNTLLAGLGLGGAALALASRDTLANFFGSITVFFDRPFRINDRIKISGYDGYITDMGLRTSRIRTLENRTVIIPNSLFASTPIENISAEPNTKVTQILNIKSKERINEAINILKDIAAHSEGTGGNPQAGITAINGTTCQVTFIFYIMKSSDYLATMHRINSTILKRFEEQNIILA